jgi:predicted CxxxxCH...CXXCH cytochrome family protein
VRTRSALALAIAAGLALALGGCDCGIHRLGNGMPAGEITCHRCHGSEENPAPPRNVDGVTDTRDRSVGAHQSHLRDGALRKAIACAECHPVPKKLEDPPHHDGVRDIRFGALATANGARPAWNKGAASCGSVYCHGATIAGGTNKAPVWTRVDGSQAACGTCHGAPPPFPHPQRTDCWQCHPLTVLASGEIDVEGGHHIDGTLDVAKLECNLCHGSAANAGPPRSVTGGTATTDLAVGAHQSHLVDGPMRKAVACEECHLVPPTPDAPGHIDGPNATVTFGSLASSKGAAPAWDRTQATCSGVYCHGDRTGGGTLKAPRWTQVDGTQAACGTCHGAPPPPPHPPRTQCFACHPGTALPSGEIDVAGGKHIDGAVQVEVNCSSCHGDAASPAPPLDVAGDTSSSARGVGAHRPHLGGSTWHAEVKCEGCHLVPQRWDDPGHIDPSPAELAFSGVARASGAAPTWDGVSCASVYCHGSTLASGTSHQPVWTGGTAQAACGTCHGVPPPAPHPAVAADCGRCHPDADLALGFADPGKHVDGHLDLKVGCSDCHGDATSPAPPVDVGGNTATTARGVGAHRAHLSQSSWHAEVKCEDCHIVPQHWDDPGHIDASPAELTFGPKASARGASPAWNGVTCSGVYCHGATLGGGTVHAPVWTNVNGLQTQCGACHGLPPPAPHPQNSSCNLCHGAVVRADRTFVDPTLHINGIVEGAGGCGSCHALPPATGTHAVHASLAPAVYGGLDTAASVPGASSYAFGCGHCHPLDPALHLSGGLADVELANPLAPAGSLKARSPAASYTRGGATFTDVNGLSYTLGTCSNVYCHSGPTYATPGGVPEPNVDFTFTGYPISYPPYTVNVTRAYPSPTWGGTGTGCGDCHGFPIRTSTPTVTAMAGQSHSFIDAQGYESGHTFNMGYAPLSCRTCHYQTVTGANSFTRDAKDVATLGPVPIVGFAQHVNGRVDIAFDVTNSLSYPSPKDLSTASWNAATQTCSNVACHLQQTAVKNGAPYRYANSPECNVCHQY